MLRPAIMPKLLFAFCALLLACLPAWALDRLGAWSGMQVFGAVAKRPLLPRELGRTLTALNQGLLRSLLVGQANAILLRQGVRAVATDTLVLNPPSFRRGASAGKGTPPPGATRVTLRRSRSGTACCWNHSP